MDDVTAGAEGVLQNKEEDRIQELAARPYQVYKNVDILRDICAYKRDNTYVRPVRKFVSS